MCTQIITHYIFDTDIFFDLRTVVLPHIMFTQFKLHVLSYAMFLFSYTMEFLRKLRVRTEY